MARAEYPFHLILRRVDDELPLIRKNEVLYRDEVGVGEIEAPGHELDFFFLPFKEDLVE